MMMHTCLGASRTGLKTPDLAYSFIRLSRG